MGRLRIYHQPDSAACICAASDAAIFIEDLRRVYDVLYPRFALLYADSLCWFSAN